MNADKNGQEIADKVAGSGKGGSDDFTIDHPRAGEAVAGAPG